MSCLAGFDLESNHLGDTHIKLNMTIHCAQLKIVMRAVNLVRVRVHAFTP